MNELIYYSQPMKVSMADDWFAIANENHFWIQWRFDAMKRSFGSFIKDGGIYLEIGCGNCIFRDQLEMAYDITVDACDLNEFALQQAKPGKGKLMVYDIFSRNLDLLNKYDGIFLMDVIEHIEDDRSFLRAAIEHAKEGGQLFINVPAFMGLYGRYDDVAGHKRRYSSSAMIKLFNDCNLDKIETGYWGSTMLPVLMMRNIILKSRKSNIIEIGFAPPNKFADLFLRFLRSIEIVLHNPLRKFAGTSLLAFGRKKG